MLLEAHNVKMAYAGAAVLAGIDFQLRAGETASLQGESGCGKSTLLSVLGGLLEPTSGMVLVKGEPLAWDDDFAMSRVRSEEFGFVFQHTQLVGSLRALDNVLLGSCFAYKGDQYDRAVGLLERMGMTDRMYHFPHQLSVGQRRRVALARALLLQPAIIIADEPTNDLDPENARAVADMLLEYADADKGRAVLLATHDPALAAKCARRYRMEGGRLHEEESRAEGGGA